VPAYAPAALPFGHPEPLRRRIRAAGPSTLPALALLLGLLATAAQAAPTAELRLEERQLTALGVSFSPLLVPTGGASSLSLPARVVIPPAQIRVLSAPAAGLVEQLRAATQQTVRAGELLARLSAPALLEAERALIQAHSQERLSEEVQKRDEALLAEGIIPEARVRATRAQHTEAQAVRRERELGLTLLGMPSEDVQRVLKGEAVPPLLSLLAPASGTVIEVLVSPGQRVDTGTPLLRIARLDKLWLELQVPNGSVTNYRPGDTLEVDGRGTRARILSVGRTTLPETQVVEVRAEIVGGGTLRPGETVAVRVRSAQDTVTRWQLPQAAVVTGRNGPQVYVQSARGVKVVAVTKVAESPSGPLVTGALTAGDRIAISGVAALRSAENSLTEGR
jgi:multidrug efflux pump subunit AcrA (membrane-fusion protein)